MRRKILASLLLAGALSGLYRLGAQTPEPVALTVRPTESKEFTFKQVDRDVYEVTTAPGSAVIRFEPVKGSLAEGISVLSFDYFCASGMEFMVVMVNDDRSRIEENMIRLPIAEGWSTFSVDVTDKLKRLQGPDDYLSLLIVPNAARPTTMRIRNARLRAYTEKEREQARLKTERERREKQLNADIEVYLKKNYPCEVSRVTVNDDRVEVSGDIKGMSGEVYLCEVPMFRELTEKDFLTVQRVKGPKRFKADFDRYAEVDGQRYDRLYSRWVLAQKSQNGMLICSHGHYADDVKAKYDLPHEVPASKKGIGGFGANRFASDLDSLDITSVTVNMWLGFMSLTPSDDAIPFDYNGRTYYADRKAIEGFDKTLQYTAARDVIVNAIVLIAPERSFADKAAGRLFEHPDFDPAGIYTMPNMTTLESLNLYAAAIDFLAERYSRPDKKYGRVHHWIAHNEVDAGWVWTNAGIKTPLRFMDIYIKSMRLLYYTARKYSPHPEVFITLTHYWQSRHNEYCYPSAQLLELLVDYTQAEGDFKWGVAHHPYPQSLFEPKSWLDDQATFDYDTPQITFKNLEVLDAWIKQPRALYQGKIKRTVFLSEQNPNSKDYSEEALREQAAGMAYAMKKLEACDGIDAYQMHGWFDQRAEGGLRIGVRRFMDDETDPGGRKPAWFVFQAFGTDREDEVFEFAKDIIGIDDWDQVIYKAPIPMRPELND
ncbi:DUF5722 domain-containing protein [Alistipes ihumii]|jgi:hypothetical protein|uniref:DUF5722 domain-containing protein n=3 Tax=Alistipes ihumii TaxID=1470347 RepID=UPI0024957FE6|nr:DUF5722 domain-containing protein [Alistipes ihumii]